MIVILNFDWLERFKQFGYSFYDEILCLLQSILLIWYLCHVYQNRAVHFPFPTSNRLTILFPRHSRNSEIPRLDWTSKLGFLKCIVPFYWVKYEGHCFSNRVKICHQTRPRYGHVVWVTLKKIQRTVRYGMVWCGVVWYGVVWCCVVWYAMVQYSVVWYDMEWCGMMWYGVVWYAMVWYGMVWMVWYGMPRYSMVWFDMVWFGFV